MNKRLKAIRHALGLSTYDFGRKVNLSAITVKTLENSEKTYADSIISRICDVYGVSEEWLKYGIGEMFSEKKVSPIDMLAEEHGLPESDVRLIESFISMSAADRKKIYEVIKILSKANLQNVDGEE